MLTTLLIIAVPVTIMVLAGASVILFVRGATRKSAPGMVTPASHPSNVSSYTNIANRTIVNVACAKCGKHTTHTAFSYQPRCSICKTNMHPASVFRLKECTWNQYLKYLRSKGIYK